jgi:Xaa-Pro aminopeptidase
VARRLPGGRTTGFRRVSGPDGKAKAGEGVDNVFEIQTDGRIRFTSEGERARRLSALRAAMRAEDLGALIVCGRSDIRFRGRVLYVSDVFQYTADCFAIVTLAGDPIFVTTPVVGLGQARLTTWVNDFRVSATPGTEVGKILLEYGLDAVRVGIVGLRDAMAVAHFQQIERTVPRSLLCDGTDLFESIRRKKSPEELANLRHTSTIFRKIFAALECEIRPGIEEADIAGSAARSAKLYGCRDIKTAMATTPFVAISYGSPKRIGKDDQVMVWIETPGPTGYWLELRRCYSFGPPPESARKYFELQRECWETGLAAMRPGETAGAVMAAVAKVVKREGHTLNDVQYSIHGIGTDAIEGVWFPGNDHELLDGEVLSFHPSVVIADEPAARRVGFLGMTDNVLVTPGGGVRLTYASDSIVEL